MTLFARGQWARMKHSYISMDIRYSIFIVRSKADNSPQLFYRNEVRQVAAPLGRQTTSVWLSDQNVSLGRSLLSAVSLFYLWGKRVLMFLWSPRYASAVLAVGLCLSACLSVCHKLLDCIETAAWVERYSFTYIFPSTYHSLQCMF